MPESDVIPAAEPSTTLQPMAVNITEAARLIGVSPRSAWTLADEGKLRTFKVGTRRLVSVKEIDRFIDAMTDAAG